MSWGHGAVQRAFASRAAKAAAGDRYHVAAAHYLRRRGSYICTGTIRSASITNACQGGCRCRVPICWNAVLENYSPCIGRGPPSEKQIGKPRPTPAILTIHFPRRRDIGAIRTIPKRDSAMDQRPPHVAALGDRDDCRKGIPFEARSLMQCTMEPYLCCDLRLPGAGPGER